MLIEIIANERARNNSVSLWKCGYLRKLANPALCGVGNKILLLYTFVTVKQKKKIYYWVVLCYKVALEHWQQGRGSKSLEWGWLRTQKEVWTIPVWLFVFIACNFKQFHFLLLHGSVCIKGSQRANNGRQRTRLPGDIPFMKRSSRKGHIYTLEACYHNDQAEKRKITNAYKVFSFWACVLAAWCSLFKWCGLISQSTANFSDVTV